MTAIDWSKAPDGATHCLPQDLKIGIYRWFMQTDGAYGWHPDKLDWFLIGANLGERSFADILVKRPTSQHWDGKGLPPAGAELEYLSISEDRWIPAVMIGTFRGAIVLGCEETGVTGQIGPDNQIRPRRTPEQIAAEERENEISVIRAIADAAIERGESAAAALYKAGYRKQEAAE